MVAKKINPKINIPKIFKQLSIRSMMFNKKKCNKCYEKINNSYDFCPHCGNPLKKSQDWGMLGKNDMHNEFEDFSKTMFGGINNKIIGKMFGSAIKILEKEMQKEIKNTSNQKSNFQLFINGKKINMTPQNTISQKPITKEIKKIPLNKFNNSQIKKFSNLPRKNLSANVKRLSNKIIYEIEMPGVNSIKDISITKLENSIEIKAIGKNNSYFKLIKLNLPIVHYEINKGKFILELESKN